MSTTSYLNQQFITNKKGAKTGVILSIKKYNELLEDLHDLAVFTERKDEPTVSHEKLIEELKKDGFI